MRRSLLLFALTACLYGQDSQPPSPRPPKETDKQQAKSTGKQNPTPAENSPPDPITSAIDRLTAEIHSNNREKSTDPKKGQPFSDWWLKWGNLVAAGTSAIAALITAALIAIQTCVMHKQRIAMDTQSTHLANTLTQTAKAADAAVSSANTARRSLEALERADLTLISVDTKPPLGMLTPIIVAIKNHGRTKATDVSVKLTVTMSDIMRVGGTPRVILNETHYPFSIGPGEDRPKGLIFDPPIIDDEMSAAITEGQFRLLATVWINYRDAFATYSWMGQGEYNRLTGDFVIHGT